VDGVKALEDRLGKCVAV